MVIAIRILRTLLVCLAVILSCFSHADMQTQLTGVVLPAQKLNLSAEQSGILIERASGGSTIRKGELLARLNDAKAKSELVQAQAQKASADAALRSAKHNRDKSARLVKENILADIALVEAEFAVETAQSKVTVTKARLKLAQQNLAQCYIKAPFNGAVVATFAQQGEWVNAGKPFMEFANLEELTLSVDLEPELVTNLQLGFTTSVLEQGELVGNATVKTIYPVIDPASGLRRVVWSIESRTSLVLSGRYVALKNWVQH